MTNISCLLSSKDLLVKIFNESGNPNVSSVCKAWKMVFEIPLLENISSLTSETDLIDYQDASGTTELINKLFQRAKKLQTVAYANEMMLSECPLDMKLLNICNSNISSPLGYLNPLDPAKKDITSFPCSADICFKKVYQDHLETLPLLETPNEKKLIMFSGPPDVGETTVAKELEKHYSAIRLSIDETQNLLEKHSFPRDLIHEYMRWCLKKIVLTFPNKFIILDCSIDRNYDEYEAFAKKFSFNTFVIRMKFDESILKDFGKAWEEYERFNVTNFTDYTFESAQPSSESIPALIQAISNPLPEEPFSVKFEKNSINYYLIRSQILDPSRKPTSFDSDYHEILPGFFLGNQDSMDNHSSFFSSILSLRSHSQLPSPSNITCKWKSIRISDRSDANIFPYFDITYEFIDKASGKILIHCFLGSSRSATIVIAYIMKKFDVSCEDAFRFVKNKRPCVQPNSGFIKQLKGYESDLLMSNKDE